MGHEIVFSPLCMIFFGTQNLVQEYIFQSKFNTGPGLFVFFSHGLPCTTHFSTAFVFF